MKKLISKFFPEYAWIPTLICVALNMIAFYGTRLFNSGLYHYSMGTSADAAIPFVPGFIVIYVLSYIQWGLGFFIIGRESREFCYRFLSAEIISKLICLVIFMAVPTVMVRPEVSGTDIFSRLTAFIYAADTPDNLFPSVHCLESAFFAAASVASKKTPAVFKWINALFSVSVFASVLFVKQHVIMDVIGGVALAFIGLLLAKLFRAERMFNVFRRRNKSKDPREDK